MDITIKVTIAVIIVLVLIIVKIIYDDKKYKEKLRIRLKNTWGMTVRSEYPYELMQHIKYYYDHNRQDNDIDEITWNDLDMETIYQDINHTRTSIGEEYLYALLRKPSVDAQELAERERIINVMMSKSDERLDMQMALSQMGKPGKISVYEYLNTIHDIQAVNKFKHIMSGLGLAAFIALCFVQPAIMIIISIIVMFYNIFSYYKDKANLDPYIQLFGFIVRTVYQSKEIAQIDIPDIEEYQHKLKTCAGKFNKFCRNSHLISGGSKMGGDILDSVADYVRMLFHIDLIKMCTMIEEAQKYDKELNEMYEIIGYIDSMISIASYRSGKEFWCVPELVNVDTRQDVYHDIHLDITNMYHPLISEPVKNTIRADKCILLTGSNASGKSTFIKTVAINAILAQTIHTVLADSYSSCFYYIYSSMALRDDIFSSESYYIVEIKSLKRILDKVQSNNIPVLCFIDEVLRGTNTLERIASSSEILGYLAKAGAMCFAATHDIELTNMLDDYYDNYHFEERVEDDDVLFDYKLREGRANTRNAIKLLNMIGYDRTITVNAEEQAMQFIANGKWDKYQ